MTASPDWVISGAKAAESKGTWKLTATSSTIRLGEVPSQTRITLEIPARGTRKIRLSAADVGKGVHLWLRLDDGSPRTGSVSVNLEGSFAEIDARDVRTDRGCELHLTENARLVVAAGVAWTLSGTRAPLGVDLEVRGDLAPTETSIKQRGQAVKIGSLSVASPGTLRVGVPIASGAMIDARGSDLTLSAKGAGGLHVLANDINFSHGVEGGCFHLTGTLQAPQLVDAQIAHAESLVVDGRLETSRILRCDSVAAGSLRSTRIQSALTVDVRGPIADECHLVVSGVVTAQSVDRSIIEGPMEIATGNAHRPDGVTTGPDAEPPAWWGDHYGEITDSRITTVAHGSVLAGDISASQITTDELTAVGTLSVSGGIPIVATRVLAQHVVLNESYAALGTSESVLSDLIVFGRLLGTGFVRADAVVVRGGLQGSVGRRLRLEVLRALRVSGAVEEVDVTAATVDFGSLGEEEQGEPAKNCALRLTGGGASTVRAGSGVDVEFQAVEHDSDVTVEGTLESLSVCDGARVFVRIRKLAEIDALHCDGEATFGVPGLDDCRIRLGLGTKRLEFSLERIVGYDDEAGYFGSDVIRGGVGPSGAFHLALASSDPHGPRHLTFRHSLGAPAWGARITSNARSPEILIHGADEDGRGGDLAITGPVVTRLMGLTTVAKLSLQAHPTTDLRGNKDERAGAPVLSLHRDADVEEAEGPTNLVLPHHGRLHGVERSADGGTLRIVGIERSETEVDSAVSGVLIDADVTDLPYSELEALGTIEVVDPLPAPLRDLARFSFRKRPERAVLRRRAEWSSTLLATLASQAVSGESRAALHWSSARLHHGALSGRRPEYYARFAHQALGYSWRPSRALLTYLVVAATLVCARVVRDSYIEVERSLWVVVGDVFTLPLGFVRLPASELLFFNRAANVFAIAALAIPLVFLVIAVRNFMRTPDDRA